MEGFLPSPHLGLIIQGQSLDGVMHAAGPAHFYAG